jgi:hypothetical protein
MNTDNTPNTTFLENLHPSSFLSKMEHFQTQTFLHPILSILKSSHNTVVNTTPLWKEVIEGNNNMACYRLFQKFPIKRMTQGINYANSRRLSHVP